MKKRRKHSRCLNCSEPLDRTFNYCPVCGQENTDNQVSLGLLMREFISNFFSLDSRFVRTFKPFLLNPGKVTTSFISGRRVLYANPIRWYLVISIFHFFFMSKVFQPTVKDMKEKGFGGEKISLDSTEFIQLYNASDTATSWPFSDSRRKMIDHLLEETNLTEDEIYDSLKIDGKSALDSFAKKKFIKIGRETKASLNSYIMKQIPIIIFFILPIYALFLKLFFWKKGLYIKHLIHSIHLHSFYFFLMTITWVLALIFDDFEDLGLPISAMLTFIYAVMSFKKVYGIRIGWSIVRATFIGFLYAITLSLVFLVGVLISLALL